jgi:hypothetical protein
MADKVSYSGRLIAVDGSRGKDVNGAADTVAAALKRAGIECGISRWDASGLFTELAAGARGDRQVSARTLSLVYAADLAFRLRWEIRPILEAGGVVIAAAYVETAVAYGTSCGLQDDWLRELLRFAPAPDWRGRSEEKKVAKAWKKRIDRGYAEFGAALLEVSAPHCTTKSARRRMMSALDQGRGRKFFRLTPKGIASLAEAVSGTMQAAAPRSRARSRSARR